MKGRRPNLGPIVFNWVINDLCNYRCPYCWHDSGWSHNGAEFKRQKLPEFSSLVQVWRDIYGRYGSCHVQISGGEPTIYPRFFELLQAISRWHFWAVTTNLAGSVERWERLLERVDPDKAMLMISFHPYEAGLDVFMRKLLRLRSVLKHSAISLVAYPPIMRDIPEYERRFSEAGFKVEISPFTGTYNGRSYPHAYSADEKNTVYGINHTSYNDKLPYAIEDRRPTGWLCESGSLYCQINWMGDIYRCSSVQGPGTKLGNLFTGFELNEFPTPCPSSACQCEAIWLVGETCARMRNFPFNVLSKSDGSLLPEPGAQDAFSGRIP